VTLRLTKAIFSPTTEASVISGKSHVTVITEVGLTKANVFGLAVNVLPVTIAIRHAVSVG